MRWLALVWLAATACLETKLVPCADGRLCPVGTICDDVHATCVTRGQLDACAGAAAGAPCVADSISGVCTDGVCFDDVCGNGIVQPDEECDDGNFVEGDGCSAKCLAEGCGNGRIDPIGAEECDDGNSLTSDGCDSTCHREDMAWVVRQCGEPRNMTGPNTIYDPQRRVLVYVDSSMVMEWDGTSWRCTTRMPDANGYTWGFVGLVYDPGRQRVVAVGYSGATEVHEWDGTSWTERTTVGTAPNLSRVTYDTRRNSVVGYGTGTQVWYLSSSDATWSSVTTAGTTPPSNYSFQLGFDHARDRLVLLKEDATLTQQTWLWDRTAALWTNTGQAFPIDSQTTMTYDPVKQRVIAFGGLTSSTYSAALYEWSGAAWVSRSTAPSPRAQAALQYQPDTSSVIVAGGNDNTGTIPDVQTLTGTTWTRWRQSGLIPRAPIDVIGFPPTGDVIAVTSTGETWTWSGSIWTKHPAAAIPITNAQARLAYDFRRARIVAYDPSGWMGEFDGTSWQTVAMDAAPLTLQVMVADVDGHRLLAIANGRTYQRGAAGWELLPTAVLCCVRSAAYDMRAHRPVIVVDEGPDAQSAYELAADDSAWIPVFDFGGGMFSPRQYETVEYYPRGTALWIDAEEGATWERLGDLWRRYGSRPMRYTFDRVAADPARQELLLISAFTGGQVYGYGYTNSNPRETCADGVDGDGDGRVGCADDDCWWKCKPTCPPFASCP